MEPWIAEAAAGIAARAPDELAALVAVSSPSGDVAGAERAFVQTAELAPASAVIERVACSSAGHAEDQILWLQGQGTGRAVLVGHVDTVVAHDEHVALHPDPQHPGRLNGSGTVDMKGGDVLALGVLRAFARRPERFAELALLLVCDEEWRVGDFAHVARFEGFDACLCFEAGQRGEEGDEEVIVRRKAAGTLRVAAHGRSAHSGANPDKGANALLALAQVAQAVAAHHDPASEHRLTAVPTVLRSGEAFNVVPGAGELLCDLRADALAAFEPVLASVAERVDGVRLEASMLRRWPGMDSRSTTGPVLEAASRALGRAVVGADRGGASDASYLAPAIPLTIDGLGPRGGGAHAPHEFVLAESLRTRAEVALAVTDAALGATSGVGLHEGDPPRGRP